MEVAHVPLSGWATAHWTVGESPLAHDPPHRRDAREMGGEKVDIPFRVTEVQRRGADGTWRYVIDHG